MTLNARKVLIVSNLVTIAVTAMAVFMGLQYNHQTMMITDEEHRHLQTDCCDCDSGLPVETPEPPPPVAFCFPSDATVQLVSGERVAVGSVEIGTPVHVGNNQYEPIYSFGHYDTKTVVNDYIKLTTASNKFVVMSPDHMVWTCNHASFGPASDVKIGDELYSSDGGCSPVTSVEANMSFQGRMAPFTPSGTIDVNGIKVSSFVALGDGDYPFHRLALAFEFPHRIMCHYLASCPDEAYTQQGISTWVARPLVWSRWILGALQGQDPFWTSLFHAVAISLAMIFEVVEFVCFQHPMLAMIAAGTYYLYERRLQPKML